MRWTLIVAALAAILVAPAQAADARYGKQQVVYHLNGEGGEGGRIYKQILQNLDNHLNAVGKDKLSIHVVMHGDGLGMLRVAQKDPQMQASIDNLKLQNVKFLVCNFTLLRRSIKLGELYDAVEDDIVPSGVAEVAHLQSKGFGYLKP
jgi:intracellular sulfur oxidation DsrE/DsrF family protein